MPTTILFRPSDSARDALLSDGLCGERVAQVAACNGNTRKNSDGTYGVWWVVDDDSEDPNHDCDCCVEALTLVWNGKPCPSAIDRLRRELSRKYGRNPDGGVLQWRDLLGWWCIGGDSTAIVFDGTADPSPRATFDGGMRIGIGHAYPMTEDANVALALIAEGVGLGTAIILEPDHA